MKKVMEVIGGAFGYLLLLMMAWGLLAILADEVEADGLAVPAPPMNQYVIQGLENVRNRQLIQEIERSSRSIERAIEKANQQQNTAETMRLLQPYVSPKTQSSPVVSGTYIPPHERGISVADVDRICRYYDVTYRGGKTQECIDAEAQYESEHGGK